MPRAAFEEAAGVEADIVEQSGSNSRIPKQRPTPLLLSEEVREGVDWGVLFFKITDYIMKLI